MTHCVDDIETIIVQTDPFTIQAHIYNIYNILYANGNL